MNALRQTPHSIHVDLCDERIRNGKRVICGKTLQIVTNIRNVLNVERVDIMIYV